MRAKTSVQPVSAAEVADRLRAAGLTVRVVGDPSIMVHGLTHDSRTVRTGQMFACLRGHLFDGHDYASQTVADGASALLVDHELAGVGETAQLVVDDTRLAVGHASAIAWGDPSQHVTMIGITGTNGKTTTAQIVAELLGAADQPTGIIGTLHGLRTTPEAPELHAKLAEFVKQGKRAVVMEVSSHALALHRIDGTVFDLVAFTNLGHDHLDLHGSPEAYFRAKSALFTPTFAPLAVINVDDIMGRLLANTLSDCSNGETMSVMTVDRNDVKVAAVTATEHAYQWNGRTISVPLGGEFNVANSLMALSIVAALDIDIDAAISGFESLAAVPGRFEVIDTDQTRSRGITVVVDYAHTPDGLERLLRAARALTDARVIAVFGCAGHRDRQKRPIMGELAARLADLAIATSDNPRGENPDAIINDVIEGVSEHYRARVIALADRRGAIRRALEVAQPDDVVVIAGKGHEATQDLGAETIKFDDRLVAIEELKDMS